MDSIFFFCLLSSFTLTFWRPEYRNVLPFIYIGFNSGIKPKHILDRQEFFRRSTETVLVWRADHIKIIRKCQINNAYLMPTDIFTCILTLSLSLFPIVLPLFHETMCWRTSFSASTFHTLLLTRMRLTHCRTLWTLFVKINDMYKCTIYRVPAFLVLVIAQSSLMY